MLVAGIEGSVQSKVYADAAAHDLLAVHLLADSNGGVDIKEGYYDSAERFKRRPGVDSGMSVNSLPYLDEVRGYEDLRLDEILG